MATMTEYVYRVSVDPSSPALRGLPPGAVVTVEVGPAIGERRVRQCKDIPDETVIETIRATPGYWRTWNQVWPRFEELLPGTPYNVFVAKVRRLARRGLLHACVHDGKKQCRGDIHLPDECKGC